MTINYERMRERWPKQKGALTRAINSNNVDKVVATCRKTLAEWEEDGGVWPDDWARWQRALDDVTFSNNVPRIDLDDLRP